jgi:hypothetical protein
MVADVSLVDYERLSKPRIDIELLSRKDRASEGIIKYILSNSEYNVLTCLSFV